MSQPYVGSLRKSLISVISEKTYTTKHGTLATMNTSAIGKPVVSPYDPKTILATLAPYSGERNFYEICRASTLNHAPTEWQPTHVPFTSGSDSPKAGAPETPQQEPYQALFPMNKVRKTKFAAPRTHVWVTLEKTVYSDGRSFERRFFLEGDRPPMTARRISALDIAS